MSTQGPNNNNAQPSALPNNVAPAPLTFAFTPITRYSRAALLALRPHATQVLVLTQTDGNIPEGIFADPSRITIG